jgi:hypothetical protein
MEWGVYTLVTMYESICAFNIKSYVLIKYKWPNHDEWRYVVLDCEGGKNITKFFMRYIYHHLLYIIILSTW